MAKPQPRDRSIGMQSACESLPPAGPDESRFAGEVRRRIDAYFAESRISTKADGAMWCKIVLGLAAWAAGFVCLYSSGASVWRLEAGYAVLAAAQVFLLLNIAHDGIHGALSRHASINRMMSYIYDGCGVNSHLVRILHNQGHHSCINMHGEDDPLDGRRVFRFTPFAAWKWFHRFQHLYAPALYALLSIDYVFIRDFEDFFSRGKGCLAGRQHALREYVILFAGKAIYLSYMVVLPIVAYRHSPAAVVAGFLGMHLLVGFLVAIVFAPTHILEWNEFPAARTEYEDYTHHIFATTADFATESAAVTWLTGGLNHHIVHHICPHVCHTHYRRLTRIVKKAAAEFQIEYKEHRTMRDALRAHYAFLKQLGSDIA
jgi:linoleoyl-CoA desaturase